jgi:LacI family transcriptional regulator
MVSPTIKDVAKLAGVSIATVSRVLNDYDNVNPETRIIVMKAVDELKYTANALAKGLRGQKTKTIGLIVNNILNPIYSVMAQGIEDTAREKGYHLFLCNSGFNPKQEEDYLEALWHKRIDGLIISPTGNNIPLLEKYLHAKIPIVQVDRKIVGLETDTVLTDNEGGANLGVKFLLSKGYKKIAIIVGMQTITTGMDRLKGYFSALSEYHLTPESSHIKIGDFTKQTGYALMKELLSLEIKPDAVFVGNNLMAFGAILAIREHKLRIPNDIGFVMFDNPEWAQIHEPPLVTVEQPTYLLGLKSAELLFNRLEFNNGSPPQSILLENKLLVGDFTI